MAMLPQIMIALFLFVAEAFPDFPAPDADIRTLVTRAKGGDRGSVSLLYQLHAQKVFRYVVCRVPTTADAEDVTAEVFVNMVEGLPTYTLTDAPFEAWLYRIAAARVADFFRRSHRRTQTDLSETLHDSAPLPEELIQQTQALDRLRSALRQLPDEHQTILILRFVERKSHAEVAQLIGKTVPAVRNAQHRALIRLSELLDSDKARQSLRASHE